jgi:hypothetical protein
MNTTQRYGIAFAIALFAALCAVLGYHAGYSAPHPMTYSQHVDGRDYLCTLSVTADGNVYDNCQLGG